MFVIPKKQAVLEYYLRSMAYNDVFTAFATGIRVRSCDLRWKKLSELPYLLPSSQEQAQIVSTIENKSKKVDALIANEQKQIEKLKQYKQSLITEVVTKGLDPSVPMKDSGVEWIGEIPKTWSISRIKYICVFNPTQKEHLDSNLTVSYAPMDCVKNGYLVHQEVILKQVNSGLTYFADGDIIMAKVTPCFENGNIALGVNLKNGVGFGSSELFVFRALQDNPRWLLYFLQNRLFVELARSTMTGTGGLKRVSPTFVTALSVPIPSEQEQSSIVEYLDAKCSQVNKLISIKQTKIDKLNEYKKSLIYEYVTGKKEA